MYNYIKGIITEINPGYIVLENNKIGFQITVANPYSYIENEEYKIYIYSHIREDEYTLYGFQTEEEKELFLKFINVKGLGPKVAIALLANGNVSGIKDAIERENILYLKKFPKVGEKLARQIILDLKGKLVKKENTVIQGDYEELISALENLGYKRSDINKVLPNINTNDKVEKQIKDALKLLLK